MNPFDLPGPQFLIVFALATLAALAAAQFLRRSLRGPSQPLREVPLLSPAEFGYLAGGPAQAVHTTLTTLVEGGRLGFDHSSETLTQFGDEPGRNELERAILGGNPSFTVREAFTAASPALDTIRKRLEELGLLLDESKAQAARILPPLLLLAVTLFGVIKIGVGLSREKSIEFLVIGCLVTLALAIWGFARRQVMTLRGSKLLADLREQHAALRASAQSAPTTLAGNDLALAVGLFGVGMLAGGAYAGLQRAMVPAAANGWVNTGGYSSCSSGWSSCGGGWSSCSSGGSSCSSGDSGGSGCGGGGGCGGCGGGGGD